MSKQINILQLKLINFKGIREFILKSDGSNTAVYGDNAVGKTTLFDAFVWLLFDKDSQNKKDFQIKTLDANGNALPGLDHEVEGIFSIDGKKLVLRKVYSEKWTKKRGSATKEFTGHTTDYFIDEVPSGKGEFNDQVSNIISEDIFKLLTSPSYFNDQLHWKKRREILLDICGDISDQDVISSSKKLTKLTSVLGDHSIEDYKKIIVSKRSKINDELEKIPVRIDESYRSIPDINGFNESDLEKEISIIKTRIEAKEIELLRVQSGGEISNKEKHIREIESEMIEIKNQLQSDTFEMLSAKQNELAELKSKYSSIKQNLSDKQWSLDRNNKLITDKNIEVKALRERWHEVNSQTYELQHDESCPTCGQSLPEEQVQAAHEKALAIFNLNKAEELERISTKGKTLASVSKQIEQENETLQDDIKLLESELHIKEMEIQSIGSEIRKVQESIKDVDADPTYAAKQKEIESIKKEITNIRSANQDVISQIRQDISKIRLDVEMKEQQKARFEQVRKIESRVEELKQNEKKLAAEFEQLEQELYLTEEFIRTKVNLLESKINSKFQYARFKLFNQQVNGGLEETCETLFGGVPYSTGLNNAARINVGLDIINTLSEHFGYTAPIFIDNAESVTRFINTTSQVISLVVSEKDKQLRVENENQKMRAVG